MPLYLHPGAPPADRWKVLDGRPELYGATWSWAAETGGHALRIIYGGVFDRHPAATLRRPLTSVPIAMRKPLPSAPSRFAAGTL